MTNASSVRLEVLIEDAYQAELERLAGPPDACTPSIWKQADLVPEADSVTVRLDGSVVGRLSSEDAATFLGIMERAGRDGEALSGVQAEIATTSRPAGPKLGISLYLPADLKLERPRLSSHQQGQSLLPVACRSYVALQPPSTTIVWPVI